MGSGCTRFERRSGGMRDRKLAVCILVRDAVSQPQIRGPVLRRPSRAARRLASLSSHQTANIALCVAPGRGRSTLSSRSASHRRRLSSAPDWILAAPRLATLPRPRTWMRARRRAERVVREDRGATCTRRPYLRCASVRARERVLPPPPGTRCGVRSDSHPSAAARSSTSLTLRSSLERCDTRPLHALVSGMLRRPRSKPSSPRSRRLPRRSSRRGDLRSRSRTSFGDVRDTSTDSRRRFRRLPGTPLWSGVSDCPLLPDRIVISHVRRGELRPDRLPVEISGARSSRVRSYLENERGGAGRRAGGGDTGRLAHSSLKGTRSGELAAGPAVASVAPQLPTAGCRGRLSEASTPP